MLGRSEGPFGPWLSAREEIALANERLLREMSRQLVGTMYRRPGRILPTWRVIDATLAAMRRADGDAEPARRAAG